MRDLKSLAATMMLTLSLSACASNQSSGIGAAGADLGVKLGAARRAQINASLAPRCPTPGRLSGEELRGVREIILAPARPRVLIRLASEYDRLDDESIACRGRSE